MLLIGILSCGVEPTAPNTGFRFASSTFQSDDLTGDDLVQFLDEQFDPTVEDDEFDAGLAAAVQALETAFPGITEIQFATSSPTEWTTAFAGVTTMSEILDALSVITFRHDVEGDECDLITIVSDLGNNGLPLYWTPDPPPDGFELPMIGFDWNVLEISMGEFEPIDISFDTSAPLYVNESAGPVTVVAPLVISPADHPGFTVRWSITPGTATPPPGGDADYGGTTQGTIVVPAGEGTVPVPGEFFPEAPNTTVYADNIVEGNETFDFVLDVDSDEPPPATWSPRQHRRAPW
jgi:hypothetical protein